MSLLNSVVKEVAKHPYSTAAALSVGSGLAYVIWDKNRYLKSQSPSEAESVEHVEAVETEQQSGKAPSRLQSTARAAGDKVKVVSADLKKRATNHPKSVIGLGIGILAGAAVALLTLRDSSAKRTVAKRLPMLNGRGSKQGVVDRFMRQH